MEVNKINWIYTVNYIRLLDEGYIVEEPRVQQLMSDLRDVLNPILTKSKADIDNYNIVDCQRIIHETRYNYKNLKSLLKLSHFINTQLNAIHTKIVEEIGRGNLQVLLATFSPERRFDAVREGPRCFEFTDTARKIMFMNIICNLLQYNELFNLLNDYKTVIDNYIPTKEDGTKYSLEAVFHKLYHDFIDNEHKPAGYRELVTNNTYRVDSIQKMIYDAYMFTKIVHLLSDNNRPKRGSIDYTCFKHKCAFMNPNCLFERNFNQVAWMSIVHWVYCIKRILRYNDRIAEEYVDDIINAESRDDVKNNLNIANYGHGNINYPLTHNNNYARLRDNPMHTTLMRIHRDMLIDLLAFMCGADNNGSHMNIVSAVGMLFTLTFNTGAVVDADYVKNIENRDELSPQNMLANVNDNAVRDKPFNALFVTCDFRHCVDEEHMPPPGAPPKYLAQLIEARTGIFVYYDLYHPTEFQGNLTNVIPFHKLVPDMANPLRGGMMNSPVPVPVPLPLISQVTGAGYKQFNNKIRGKIYGSDVNVSTGFNLRLIAEVAVLLVLAFIIVTFVSFVYEEYKKFAKNKLNLNHDVMNNTVAARTDGALNASIPQLLI